MTDDTVPEAKLSVDDNNEPTLKRKAEPAQTDISPESKHNKVDKEETEDTQKPITSSSETDQELPKRLFWFKRKSQRMKEANNKADHYPPITLDLEQSVIALEQGLRCDCFIVVDEGRIPAHSVFMRNARTIGAAFASFARESVTMTFDMSAWPTEGVLDVIQMIYTASLEHLKPISATEALQFFEMLVFLDHPQADKFLLRIMVSALLTLDARNESRGRCQGLDPTILRHNLGMIESKGELSKTSWEILFRILWIVMEGEELPAFDQDLKDTFLALFCRGVFRSIYTMEKPRRTRECIAYFCSFSFSTVLHIVQQCARNCLEYDWDAMLDYVMYWMNWDPANRMEGIELLKNICFQNVLNTTIERITKNPTCVLVDGNIIQQLARAKYHITELERIRSSDCSDQTTSPMTPFTIYYSNTSTYIDQPPPPSNPPSTESIIDTLDKPQLKIFGIGMEMMMKWLQATENGSTEHQCTRFPRSKH